MKSNARGREKNPLRIAAVRDSKLAITTWGRMLESFWTFLGKRWLSAQWKNWIIAMIRKVENKAKNIVLLLGKSMA